MILGMGGKIIYVALDSHFFYRQPAIFWLAKMAYQGNIIFYQEIRIRVKLRMVNHNKIVIPDLLAPSLRSSIL